jgi:dTDP-4-amino-4,6-dideoxygalactose transaminase
VLAASNCDVALTLAVAALGLPRGGRAVLPSFGFPSTVNALEWNGLEPRFLDVDPDDWCLHPEQLAGQLDGVVLILATHMFGVPCDVAGLERLASESEIALVFDAAHAIATRVGAKHITEFGDASAISNGATKLAPTGEGALAILRDDHTAERFRLLRTSGMQQSGVSAMPGLNAKLSELHAALATLTLGELEAQVGAREQLVSLYRSHLGALGAVQLQQIPPGCRPTPSYFAADFGESRGRVIDTLAAHGIESRPYFPAMHLMPRFAGSAPSLPVTERLDRSVLALPLYSDLPSSEVEEICALTGYALEEAAVPDG